MPDCSAGRALLLGLATLPTSLPKLLRSSIHHSQIQYHMSDFTFSFYLLPRCRLRLCFVTRKHGSVYAGGFGCIGVVLAAMEGEAGFYDDWFLQAEYGILMPAIVFAVAMLAEFWVEGLPSQVRRMRTCLRVAGSLFVLFSECRINQTHKTPGFCPRPPR